MNDFPLFFGQVSLCHSSIDELIVKILCVLLPDGYGSGALVEGSLKAKHENPGRLFYRGRILQCGQAAGKTATQFCSKIVQLAVDITDG